MAKKPNEITINIFNRRKKRARSRVRVKPKMSLGRPGEPVKQWPLSEQCKAAIWLYGWLEEWLRALTGATQEQLDIINSGISSVTAGGIRAVLTEIVVAVLAVLVITPGPTIDDLVIAPFIFFMAQALAWALYEYGVVPQYTVADIEGALIKVQVVKDDIICQLSQVQISVGLDAAFENAIASAGLSIEQKILCRAIFNDTVLLSLYYTRWFWPSFNDEQLSQISGDCC